MTEPEKTEPPIVFRKTKSEKWAVMGPVETLKKAIAGDGKVEVTKKSGDMSSFTVVSLGSAFDVDGVQMCYGYDTPPDADAAGGKSGASSAPSNAVPANAPAPDSSEPLPQFQGSAEDEESLF